MMEEIQEVVQEDSGQQPDVVISGDSVANINVSYEDAELLPYQKMFIEEKRKNVILRGFRKGTAPESMVAKFFSQEARAAAINNLLYAKYTKLMQDYKLQPLTQPKLEKFLEKESKAYANFIVEVIQPITLNQYLGLELKMMPIKSIDDAVAQAHIDIKHKYPKLINLPDGIVENGKVAVINFTMYVDDKEFEKQEDLKIIVGSNLYYAEFETSILGLKPNDIKEFGCTFPDTYQKDELKGKTAHFNLLVKSVHDAVEYSDDELATMLKYETKDAMFNFIRKEIEDKYKEEEHLFYENQVLGQLLSTHSFKIPKTLIDNEVSKIFAEKPDVAPEQVPELAERFVRTDLILSSIYDKHPDIHLQQEEFNEKMAGLATRANATIEHTMQKLQDAGKMQSYINYLKNCKVINFLIEMADKKEEVSSVVISENNNVVETTGE